MPKKPAFPGLLHAMKEKQTLREFLSEMDAVVPWPGMLALIGPHYPKVGPKGGRPPMPLETMLRIYFLQNWYAISDPMAEKTLYDSNAPVRGHRTWRQPHLEGGKRPLIVLHSDTPRPPLRALDRKPLKQIDGF